MTSLKVWLNDTYLPSSFNNTTTSPQSNSVNYLFNSEKKASQTSNRVECGHPCCYELQSRNWWNALASLEPIKPNIINQNSSSMATSSCVVAVYSPSTCFWFILINLNTRKLIYIYLPSKYIYLPIFFLVLEFIIILSLNSGNQHQLSH